MTEKLIGLLVTILAACLVMILHEIPKTMIYKRREKKRIEGFRIWHYIDPVGLIFAVIGYCGFSKPYAYHVRNKKTNLYIGYTGLASLLILFFASTFGCKYVFGPMVVRYAGFGAMQYVSIFIFWTVQYMAVISLGMFFANLFPIVPFDMGNLTAGYSTVRLLSILKNDYQIKMLFFLVVIFDVIKRFSIQIFLVLYRL